MFSPKIIQRFKLRTMDSKHALGSKLDLKGVLVKRYGKWSYYIRDGLIALFNRFKLDKVYVKVKQLPRLNLDKSQP